MVYRGKKKFDGELMYGTWYLEEMISKDGMNWYPVIPESVEIIENKEEN